MKSANQRRPRLGFEAGNDVRNLLLLEQYMSALPKRGSIRKVVEIPWSCLGNDLLWWMFHVCSWFHIHVNLLECILCALNSKWSDLEGEPAERNRINSHDGQTISCDGIWQ